LVKPMFMEPAIFSSTRLISTFTQITSPFSCVGFAGRCCPLLSHFHAFDYNTKVFLRKVTPSAGTIFHSFGSGFLVKFTISLPKAPKIRSE